MNTAMWKLWTLWALGVIGERLKDVTGAAERIEWLKHHVGPVVTVNDPIVVLDDGNTREPPPPPILPPNT